MRKILGFIAMTILLGGCATATQKISDADRGKIDSVLADEIVQKGPQMYYMGPGSGIGMMFGAIGGAITALSNESPGETIRKFAEKNDIHVDKIAKEEVLNAFAASGKIKVNNPSTGNTAKLVVSVPVYGLSIPNGFSSQLVPVLLINCEMFDSSGKKIWASRDDVSLINSPVPSMSLEQLKNDPKLIEKAWRAAAKEIAQAIVNQY